MVLSIQIAKFKFHQYELRAVSPNLMLAMQSYPVYGSCMTEDSHHGEQSDIECKNPAQN